MNTSRNLFFHIFRLTEAFINIKWSVFWFEYCKKSFVFVSEI